MFRLKANKTSLYKLVGEFEDLPPMRRVTITKAYRTPDWWLKWTNADGLLCVAFFSTCMGKALLSIDKKEFCGPQVSHVSMNWTPRTCWSGAWWRSSPRRRRGGLPVARCKFCGQEIDWITSMEGKQVPVIRIPVFVIEDGSPEAFLDDMGATITGRQAKPEEESRDLPVAFVLHRRTCPWADKPTQRRVERGGSYGGLSPAT